MPFVGTVPAIKPAAAQTKSGIIGVLATPGTAKREYTHALIHTYAYHCKVFLHGAKRLAEIAEAKLKGHMVTDARTARRDRAGLPHARRQATDVVVLGCTHYPLLTRGDRAESRRGPSAYIDPAPAIARRVTDVLQTTQRGAGKRPRRRNSAPHLCARQRVGKPRRLCRDGLPYPRGDRPAGLA